MEMIGDGCDLSSWFSSKVLEISWHRCSPANRVGGIDWISS